MEVGFFRFGSVPFFQIIIKELVENPYLGIIEIDEYILHAG